MMSGMKMLTELYEHSEHQQQSGPVNVVALGRPAPTIRRAKSQQVSRPS